MLQATRAVRAQATNTKLLPTIYLRTISRYYTYLRAAKSLKNISINCYQNLYYVRRHSIRHSIRHTAAVRVRVVRAARAATIGISHYYPALSQ
jgi:hypothetical protein